jgi:hypothetical protein
LWLKPFDRIDILSRLSPRVRALNNVLLFFKSLFVNKLLKNNTNTSFSNFYESKTIEQMLSQASTKVEIAKAGNCASAWRKLRNIYKLDSRTQTATSRYAEQVGRPASSIRG